MEASGISLGLRILDERNNEVVSTAEGEEIRLDVVLIDPAGEQMVHLSLYAACRDEFEFSRLVRLNMVVCCIFASLSASGRPFFPAVLSPLLAPRLASNCQTWLLPPRPVAGLWGLGGSRVVSVNYGAAFAARRVGSGNRALQFGQRYADSRPIGSRHDIRRGLSCRSGPTLVTSCPALDAARSRPDRRTTSASTSSKHLSGCSTSCLAKPAKTTEWAGKQQKQQTQAPTWQRQKWSSASMASCDYCFSQLSSRLHYSVPSAYSAHLAPFFPSAADWKCRITGHCLTTLKAEFERFIPTNIKMSHSWLFTSSIQHKTAHHYSPPGAGSTLPHKATDHPADTITQHKGDDILSIKRSWKCLVTSILWDPFALVLLETLGLSSQLLLSWLVICYSSPKDQEWEVKQGILVSQ
ncbi:unnamed protein product [Protopolystoma xenopodis]|uniref:Uncharacterized protein n=1 Tax=Protopolystoma xenopodis TaxID=117903 RepID=A0A3S4ZMN2_9PLAT|nr:unnamed protein product [Protopolystoma xenopodis]